MRCHLQKTAKGIKRGRQDQQEPHGSRETGRRAETKHFRLLRSVCKSIIPLFRQQKNRCQARSFKNRGHRKVTMYRGNHSHKVSGTPAGQKAGLCLMNAYTLNIPLQNCSLPIENLICNIQGTVSKNLKANIVSCA